MAGWLGLVGGSLRLLCLNPTTVMVGRFVVGVVVVVGL